MPVLELRPTLVTVLALLLFLPLTSAQARMGDWVHVECAEGRSFELLISQEHAVVELKRRRLVLQRRPSSIGQQYRTREVTLIIDGDFVAFVPDDDLDWRDCHIVGPNRAWP
mgnify:CR=1 FL=1